MDLKIEQFMCRSDNFGVLLHDPKSGQTALIDAPEEAPILAAVERTGWTPTVVFTTHHHGDHIEANLALKQRFRLRIIGPEAEAAKIPGVDETVEDGSRFDFAGRTVHVIATPGHTAGHVCYHLPEEGLAFTGDTLFAMGCGRLFERPAPVMLQSLRKLAALPPETVVHCGHEYTLSNARFALSVDPDNAALKQRAAEVERQRAAGQPTLPTTIAAELATNPFLRAGDASIRRHLGMEAADEAEVFAELRRRKDNF